ncbi:MAG: cytochrome c [Deltaproteobacteria bacterium]|nr:cytochrome c [Deltaproteobacteria bacterium]
MTRFAARLLIASCLSLLASQLACAGDAFVFKDHGKVVRTVSFEELAKISKPQAHNIFEPHESIQVTYQGLDFNALLDAVYGKAWKQAEELLFTCSDGYQPSIPGSRFAQYKSYLTISRDGGAFQLTNRLHNGQLVKLGPFYLIWENAKNEELRTESDTGYWPYQVTTVDLINFADRFPRLAPPTSASKQAKAGFVNFRNYCMRCHSINGEGGRVAPELNYPVNITEYYNEPMLKKWILEPTSVRYRTTMPALGNDLKDRSRLVDDIIAYFKAMRSSKQKPAPEKPESK